MTVPGVAVTARPFGPPLLPQRESDAWVPCPATYNGPVPIVSGPEAHDLDEATRMPAVSIIVPTYNRRETILRSLRSIVAQTFEDWELLVVDDGSEDGTAELIAGFDPRLRVIRQANRGITGARNTGLRESKGDYLAFLDSDDEWLPHHLALLVGYLRAHSERAFVSAEFWESFGPERVDEHYRLETGQWYPEMARKLRSRALDLPPGEDDDYLRFYDRREPIGAWGEAIVREAGFPHARLYRGSIFRHWRWGYLMAMQTTVLTRAAYERIGGFDERYVNASDHGFLARLCGHFEASYLSLPTAIKHEFTPDGRIPAEDHLATGRHRVTAAREMLRWFEELHLAEAPDDPELLAIRDYRRYWLARLLAEEGQVDEARALVRDLAARLPDVWQVKALSHCLRVGPGDVWPARLMRLSEHAARAFGAVARRLS